MTDVTKELNILSATRWVALAWSEMRAETIEKCFRKAGILIVGEMQVVTRPHNDGPEPFSGVDQSLEVQALIDRTLSPGQNCSALEYIEECQ